MNQQSTCCSLDITVQMCGTCYKHIAGCKTYFRLCLEIRKGAEETWTVNLDTWLAVHHSITFLLLPTWYTNFLFIYTNYNKLNSSTCFERIPPIIRRSRTQIVRMQPLVSSLSASDCLVQPLSGCTRQSPAESDDTRGCIRTICVDLLMMGGMRSKHVEEFNLL